MSHAAEGSPQKEEPLDPSPPIDKDSGKDNAVAKDENSLEKTHKEGEDSKIILKINVNEQKVTVNGNHKSIDNKMDLEEEVERSVKNEEMGGESNKDEESRKLSGDWTDEDKNV